MPEDDKLAKILIEASRKFVVFKVWDHILYFVLYVYIYEF